MYVITGASGNTGKLIAKTLLEAGKKVKVISRNPDHVADLVTLGATAAIGNLNDAAFLTEAFRGAKAVYTLIPPAWDVTNWRQYQTQVGFAIASAVQAAGVPFAVNLSSQGAHLPEGAGPVSGLFYMEQMLDSIPNLNVKHLRAGFFMQNFLNYKGMMQHLNLFGTSLKSDLKLPIVHVRDIAAVAAEELLSLGFQGSSVRFVAGAADRSMSEVTSVLGKFIGKTDLPYVQFSPEDELQGALQNGLAPAIAEGYRDLYHALNYGEYQAGYVRDAASTTPTTLEWFAENEF
ncbi:MAG: NmrA family NAD(P)-binding protein [Saprospiraceae bacterium]|nr:NmrA family NAD(P)-binding protein [Saprospiraceae bacterium]